MLSTYLPHFTLTVLPGSLMARPRSRPMVASAACDTSEPNLGLPGDRNIRRGLEKHEYQSLLRKIILSTSKIVLSPCLGKSMAKQRFAKGAFWPGKGAFRSANSAVTMEHHGAQILTTSEGPGNAGAQVSKSTARCVFAACVLPQILLHIWPSRDVSSTVTCRVAKSQLTSSWHKPLPCDLNSFAQGQQDLCSLTELADREIAATLHVCTLNARTSPRPSALDHALPIRQCPKAQGAQNLEPLSPITQLATRVTPCLMASARGFGSFLL